MSSPNEGPPKKRRKGAAKEAGGVVLPGAQAKQTKQGAGAAAMSEKELDAKFLEFCSEARTQQEIQAGLGIDNKAMMDAVNRLQTQNRLSLLTKGEKLVFQAKSIDSMQTEAKMGTAQERLIYQHIKAADTKGIRARDLRGRTGLEKTTFSRLLRKMESRKLIKKVSSIATPKQPVYMLAELTPHKSLTGGVFYTSNEFDRAFSEMLNKIAVKFANDRVKKAEEEHVGHPLTMLEESCFHSRDLLEHINSTGLSNEPLTESDLSQILATLVWDAKLSIVEQTSTKSGKDKDGGAKGEDDAQAADDGIGNYKYKARRVPAISLPVPGTVRHSASVTGMLSVPCGKCPVFDKCHVGSRISPATCIYLNNW